MARILYLWQSAYPWEVRAEKITLSLVDAGFEVALLARVVNASIAVDPRVRLLGVEAEPSWRSAPLPGNFLWTRRLRAAMKEAPPDLVIARDLYMGALAGPICRRAGVPMILDMAEHYPAAMRGWERYRRHPLLRFAVHGLGAAERLEVRALRFADATWVVCEENAERIEREAGYRRERATIVSNTPELSRFREVRPGSVVPPRVIAHHGHMTPERGLETLVRAFARIEAEFPECRMVLAGGGECESAVRAEIARLGLAMRVELRPAFRPSEYPALLSEMDVGVLPYPVTELTDHTVSNKLFDYFACGKPVLCSAARPMSRLCRESGAGLSRDLATPESLAQALREFLRMPLAGLSESGRKAAAERFHWGVDRARMLASVEQVLRR